VKTTVPRSPAAELVPLVKLLAEDPRYKIEAYQFVGAGLEFAQEVLGLGTPGKPKKRSARGDKGPGVRHVTGQDLCWALRELAHKQYGFMSKLVLASWGIHATSDFGTIVYNLIRIGKMSMSQSDRREDFDNVYDFEQALVRDYAIIKEEQPCRP
jgi:uncharacterized repeat protein (TIGR04138 family)